MRHAVAAVAGMAARCAVFWWMGFGGVHVMRHAVAAVAGMAAR